jgi:hypothetical protein
MTLEQADHGPRGIVVEYAVFEPELDDEDGVLPAFRPLTAKSGLMRTPSRAGCQTVRP